MKHYFINNNLVHDCSFSVVSDRAVCYGDGVFETTKYVGGTIPLLEFHLKRLEHSCSKLHINISLDDIKNQISVFIKALQKNGVFSGVIRIFVCREGQGRGSYLPENASSKTLLSHQPLPAEKFQEKKVTLIKSGHMLPKSPGLAGIKHISRLEYIYAELSLGKPIEKDQELLFFDEDHRLVETMHHNIFFRSEQSVFTPKLDWCGVNGIMRQWVVANIPLQGYSIQEDGYDIGIFEKVDEVFITNAVQGIVSVSKFKKTTFKDFSLASTLQAELQKKFNFYES